MNLRALLKSIVALWRFPRAASGAPTGASFYSRENSTHELEASPPDAARVAARAIVLALVTCRGRSALDDEGDASEGQLSKLREWMLTLGIDDEFEHKERQLVAAPTGQLDEQSAINAMWRDEGMLVLMWALGRVDLPRYDEGCHPIAVYEKIRFGAPRAQTVLAKPSLRPREELEHWANTYLTLHWRLRQYSISPTALDFVDYVEHHGGWGPLTLEHIELAEGDLAVRGERIDRISEDHFHELLSIVRERHKALNWLLGRGSVYSRVGTPT